MQYSKALKSVPAITTQFTRSFGGGGGRGVALPVDLNPTKNYVDHKSYVRLLTFDTMKQLLIIFDTQSQDKVALFGWKEANDEAFHIDNTDAFAHLRGKPLFSFERLYFNDPHYVKDEDEPLMNDPHGYLIYEDPFDTRANVERPLLEGWFLFWVGLALVGLFGTNSVLQGPIADDLYNFNLAAQQIEDEIRNIRLESQRLEQRRDELQAKLQDL